MTGLFLIPETIGITFKIRQFKYFTRNGTTLAGSRLEMKFLSYASTSFRVRGMEACTRCSSPSMLVVFLFAKMVCVPTRPGSLGHSVGLLLKLPAKIWIKPGPLRANL